METKTCRFSTILDSATHFTSCRRFFKVHFHCRKSPTLLPFKPLIMVSPTKLLTIAFCCGFVGSFLNVHVPDIIRKLNNNKNCQSKQNVYQFYIFKWTVGNFRTKTMVTQCQKKRATCVYVLFISIFKIRAREGSVLQSTCGILEQN